MKILKNIVNKVKNVKRQLDKKREEALKQEHCIDVNLLPESKEVKINLEKIITFEFILKIGFAVLFIVYLGYIGAKSLDVIYAIIISFIVSMAMEKLITFFSKFIPRGVSIILSYILVFIFLMLGFVISIPFVLSNLSQVADIIVNKVNVLQIKLQNQTFQQFVQSLHLYPFLEEKILAYTANSNVANELKDILSVNVSNILQVLTQSLKGVSSFAFEATTFFFNTIVQISTIFILAIFFSFEKDKVVYTLATLSKKPKYTALKLKKLYHQLGEWMKGQLLMCVFIGLAIYLGLWTLALFGINLDSKLTLALIASLTEIIPYLGPILGALPALLVGTLSYGFTGFIGVTILYVVVQQVEGWIVPIVMNKALGVNSLLIFISMLFGAKIMGFAGVMLAIPLAVVISLMFEDKLK